MLESALRNERDPLPADLQGTRLNLHPLTVDRWNGTSTGPSVSSAVKQGRRVQRNLGDAALWLQSEEAARGAADGGCGEAAEFSVLSPDAARALRAARAERGWGREPPCAAMTS